MRLYLDDSLYKAVGKNPTKRDIEEHVWKLVSEKYPQKDAVKAFHEILNNLRVESGLSQYYRSGKRKGQVIHSKDAQGNPLAFGIGQQIASTAKRLGIDPKKWKESVEGVVKYKTQLAQQARKLGVPEKDVRRVASGAYFTGGSERPENQAILAAARKKDPNATMRDILTKPQYRRARRGLKGMTKLMARYGIEGTRAGLEASVAGNKESQYYTDKSGKRRRRHAPAVQKYIRAVHKNPRRHMRLDESRNGGYEPVGGTREIAEKYGTRGYIKRDPVTGEGIASMSISESRARPEDLSPRAPKPKAVASKGPDLSSPVAAPARRQAEAKRVAGLESASRDLGLPSPSKVLANRPQSGPVMATRPTPVRKSLFQTEYFIEG